MIRFIIILAIFFTSCTSSVRYAAIKKQRHQDYKQTPQIESDFQGDVYDFMDEWLGTPYKYGGENKNGIDCSGFTSQAYLILFNKEIPRTAYNQYKHGRKINFGIAREGDLVFFRGVLGAGIDHVGIYLGNNKFGHASVSDGVVISDLDETYYSQRLVGFCRY